MLAQFSLPTDDLPSLLKLALKNPTNVLTTLASLEKEREASIKEICGKAYQVHFPPYKV